MRFEVLTTLLLLVASLLLSITQVQAQSDYQSGPWRKAIAGTYAHDIIAISIYLSVYLPIHCFNRNLIFIWHILVHSFPRQRDMLARTRVQPSNDGFARRRLGRRVSLRRAACIPEGRPDGCRCREGRLPRR